jgi:hypothetical protein
MEMMRIASYGMRYRHHLVLEETEGEKAGFATGFAVILGGEGKPRNIFSESAKSMPCFLRFARRFASPR